MKTKDFVISFLANANIKVGENQGDDVIVRDENAYDAFVRGSLAIGESYMRGEWDSDKLDEVVYKIYKNGLQNKISKNFTSLLHYFKSVLLNKQNVKRAFEVGEKHYDAGNDIYRLMLDKRLVYTCAYFLGDETLDVAQENKLDLICRKIGLKKGDKVLDIGCGWGSFAKFAAEKYGAIVTGVTISREQIILGQELCKGLPVTFKLMDYRDINEKFDHIVSIGMFEHVGYKNYNSFFQVAERCLNDGGLFLLHTIGSKKPQYHTDPWYDKYIFPNGNIPSLSQIAASAEKRFVIEDVHNISYYYYKTLMHWYNNFVQGYPSIKNKYSETFYRMYKFYLLTSAGSFKSRQLQLFQLVLSKNGVEGGYKSIR